MIIVAIATWLLFLGATPLHAQGQFYEGKTIRIVVGLPAGDAYDLYARMAAAHMEKYIPRQSRRLQHDYRQSRLRYR